MAVVRRNGSSKPKTDLGTIILHWLLVTALCVAVTTGLSIARIGPSHYWLDALEPLLPYSHIWSNHCRSAFVLLLIAIAYPVYMSRAFLTPRVRLDRVRLRDLGRRHHGWGTVNIILHWLCYLTLLTELLTGCLLYLDRGGAVTLRVHWLGTWAVIAFLPLHVLSQLAFGGLQQLLRLFRPVPLSGQGPSGLDARSHSIHSVLIPDDRAQGQAGAVRDDEHGRSGGSRP